MPFSYKILIGAIWTHFDELRGATPLVYEPADLSDEIKFSVSLRGMSVFSSRPSNISYSNMIATLPFPEYELFSISTVLYEASNGRGGFNIHLISLLVPQVIMENAWIDLRQLQAIFGKHFARYQGEPIPDKKRVLSELAYATDEILQRKLQIIDEGVRIREQFSKYLKSYLVTSLSDDEQRLVQTRVKTLVLLLDRVLEAGDNEQIQRALERMNFILQQELSDDIIGMYQQTIAHLI